MKEGLSIRLQLIHSLATIRHGIMNQVPPDKPTKALEAINLLKSALQIVGNKLADPEPSLVTFTEDQIAIAKVKNGSIAVRAKKLMENLARTEATLLTDHGEQPVMDWTDEQREAIVQHYIEQLQALLDDIEAL